MTHILVDLNSYSSIGQGTWVNTVNTNDLLNTQWNNNASHADGDNISYKIYPETGTYTLRLIARHGVSLGILDIDIDGVEVASFDCFNAVATYNNVHTQTGISLTGGLQDLKLRLDGTNGTDHKTRLATLSLWRTA